MKGGLKVMVSTTRNHLEKKTVAGKSYTGEESASFEKLENLFEDQREV